MHRISLGLLLLLTLLFVAQCSRTPPVALNQETAQRAIDAWAKSQSFTGQIKAAPPKITSDLVGVGLECTDFHFTFEGQPRTFSGTGMADFKKESDGRWILDDVQLFQISGGQYPAFKIGSEVK